MLAMWGIRKRNGNSRMIRQQITARGITNPQIISAMKETDRRIFVPDELAASAYEDHPVTLMPGATVSQPFIVALMTDLLALGPHHKVLEIGTGSGYQAAVLSRIAREVWSVEMQEPLVGYARERLNRAGAANVHVIHGDGWNGYPEAAPYDRIIVTAAPEHVPEALIAQLAPGGRMVMPVGAGELQELEILRKNPSGDIERATHSPVKFVPLIHLTSD
jgi:protein-L-isoaspartate(D-aspartate) O-methyltransferase